MIVTFTPMKWLTNLFAPKKEKEYIDPMKKYLIVGLGNIGAEYVNTRHNIGFKAVEALAASQDFEPWTVKKDLKCQVTTATIGDTRVVLCKPTTMMNLSGEASSRDQACVV